MLKADILLTMLSAIFSCYLTNCTRFKINSIFIFLNGIFLNNIRSDPNDIINLVVKLASTIGIYN